MAQAFRRLPLLLCVGLIALAFSAGCDSRCPENHCRLPGGGCESGIDTDGDGVCDRAAADWSREARLPEEGHRTDIFRLGPALPEVHTRGLEHALLWPVEVSGVLLPWQPMRRLYDPNATEQVILTVQSLSRNALGFGTLPEMFDWVGLPRWDGEPEAHPGVRWPERVTEGDYLGVGAVETELGPAMTFSCASCHTANLFGRTVMGLTNRQAQANEFFHLGKSFFPELDPKFFEEVGHATEDEVELLVRTQEHFAAVGSKLPQVRGLDTSLAQVALSLARRSEDAWATRSEAVENSPRPNRLEDFTSDSKPAVWWTLKYKTRWLSDGSIVTGNPIFTNFLWNELGRGTDLDALEGWLQRNQHVVDELTAAAFATQAPRWEDFFGVESIDEAAAIRGEAHFVEHCATCHGTYEKGWSAPDADTRSKAGRLQTTRVRYHAQTPVLDVGTSPNRAEGMGAFADRLNELAVSKWMKTVVEVQPGYVPPPLDAVWARYPYLHNQSVPTLCDLLLPAELRTAEFWMGPDENPDTDYDHRCVGLPVGDRVPESWKEDPRRRFDTTLSGLSNQGHDAWLRGEDGGPLLDETTRMELIEFLKTL